MTKLEALKKQFSSAVERFEESLQAEKSAMARDSAIKRFEFNFDLSWKLIKAFLEEDRGLKCVSPKGCFQEAYHQGVIDYNDLWMEMVNDRNFVAHTYKEEKAEMLYSNLPGYLKLFKELLSKIK